MTISTNAVIFDLDGTLVDTAPDLMAATNHILALLKRRAITMAEVRAFVGHGAKALIARGAQATGEPLQPDDISYYYAEFLRFYSSHIADHSRPFPGVVDLLNRLRVEGFALGICTNKPEKLAVDLLKRLALFDYFGAVIGPDTMGRAKPDPAPYYETVKRLGADNSLLVGDSETDVATARTAQVPIIGVSFGYTVTPMAALKPDALIDHYDEAWEAIIKLMPKFGTGS